MKSYFEPLFAWIVGYHIYRIYHQDLIHILFDWSHDSQPYWFVLFPGLFIYELARLYLLPLLIGLCILWGGIAWFTLYRTHIIKSVLRTMVCLGYLNIFLCSRVFYMNHHYLILLFLLTYALHPLLHDKNMILCQRWLLASAFIWAGIAKINGDWLVYGSTLKIWFLEGNADFPNPLLFPLLQHYGPFSPSTLDALAIGLSWSAMLIDFLGGIFLLVGIHMGFKSLLYIAIFFHGLFHTMNNFIFDIGVFPIFMVVSFLLWFEDQPTSIFPSLQPKVALGDILTFVLIGLIVFVPSHAYIRSNDPTWEGKGIIGSWRMMLHQEAELSKLVGTPKGEYYNCSIPLDAHITVFEFLHCPSRHLHLSVAGLQLSLFQRTQILHDPELLLQVYHDLLLPQFEALQRDYVIEVDAWKAVNDGPYMRWLEGNIERPRIVPRDNNFVTPSMRAKMQFYRRKHLHKGIEIAIFCLAEGDSRGWSGLFINRLSQKVVVGAMMGEYILSFEENQTFTISPGKVQEIPLKEPHIIKGVDLQSVCFYYGWKPDRDLTLGDALQMR